MHALEKSRHGNINASTIIFFFFQAEDGIRDLTVTGVQTCALPISIVASPRGTDKKVPRIRMLPCSAVGALLQDLEGGQGLAFQHLQEGAAAQDRKSTRLNSSHSQISYAVFCLKKKNNSTTRICNIT